MTHDKLCAGIGIGGRARLIFTREFKALDLYRVCKIADALDVRVDWLLGRSDVMEVPGKATGMKKER